MRPSLSKNPYFLVRNSRIHGRGVFAAKNIAKGTRITEYVGERITHAEADRRHGGKADDDNHTFLFTVTSRSVIDGGNGGNDARWINHSCDPNCESVIEKSRVFVEAVRDIPKGTELCYDYMIERDPNDPPGMDQVFGCRCGAANCRGTMLVDPVKPARKAKSKAKAKAKTNVKAKAKSKAKAKAKTNVKAKAKSKAKAKAKTNVKVKAKAKVKKKASTSKRSQR